MFLPDKQKSSFQIRGGHFKGAMFPFDFKKFAEEIAKNTVIKDVWGDKHDIVADDIQYIFTSSQFKMHSYYNSWNEYKEQFKAQGIRFSVNSWANSAKDKVRANYQVLQTLPPNSDITAICNETLNRLTKLHTDLDYVKEVMKLDKTSPKHYLATALQIYPQLIFDDYIKKQIESFIFQNCIRHTQGRYGLTVITRMPSPICTHCVNSYSAMIKNRQGLCLMDMSTTNIIAKVAA
jgi:hypothetical protein